MWNIRAQFLILDPRIYSYSLGRPPMVRKESHDVVLPILDHTEGDLRTTFPIYQTKFLQLCSLVGEVMDKVSAHVLFFPEIRPLG